MTVTPAGASLLRAYFGAFCTLAMMYAPQPLFTAMARDLEVGQSGVSLLVTVVLLPLALAPLAYGFLLEAVPARRVLFGSMAALALLQALMALAPEYWQILALRCGQGLLAPAMLTGLMTHIGATQDAGSVQRSMAVYIASTICGAFFGRLGSGFVATHFGWRASLMALAVVLACCALLLHRLPQRSGAGFRRLPLAALPRVFLQPGFARMYLVVFCAFFVFASLLNVLPFRLAQVAGDVSELRIALMYSGYLLGVLICVRVMPIVRLLGGERRAVLLGLGCFLLVVALFAGDSPLTTQAAMLLFPPGFFLAHAVMPGYMNRLGQARGEPAGLVNGLYLALYYFGGALGSWLPGLAYRNYGWGAYVGLSCAMLGCGLLLARGMPRATPRATGASSTSP